MPPSVDPQSRVTRTVVVRGRRTSIRIESVFWTLLTALAEAERTSIDDVLSELDARRGSLNLTAAIRVFTVTYFQGSPPAHRQPAEETEGA
jgi:predicted DNA-binding ribbon-helix-helix protein